MSVQNTPTRSFQYESTSGETATEAVCMAVADMDACSPTDLPPLADAIDPDALNDIFRASNSSAVEVAFPYADKQITVARNRISIERCRSE